PTEQLKPFDIVGLLTPTALRERNDVAVGNHPFGIVVERIVIPISFLAELEGGFEFVGHAGALLLIALLAISHREQVMGVSFVVFGLENLESVFGYVSLNKFPPRAVIVIAFDPWRPSHRPNHFQITAPREFDVRCASPPIQRLLIMRPGFSVIVA